MDKFRILERMGVGKGVMYWRRRFMEDHTGYGGGGLEGSECLVTFDIYTFYGGVCVMLDVGQWNNCGVDVEGRRKV